MIHTEQTPNPNSLKFLSDFVISSVGTEEFQKKEIGKINNKFIKELLNFDGVELVLLSKLEKSKSEIRRLIKGNAVKINDNIVSDDKFEINKNLFNDNYLKLSLGKKRHIKIELD